MKSARRYRIVLVTAPDVACARALAQAALEARLIACANIIPRLESHYWWQGKLESSGEALLLLKTTPKCLPALERLILAQHPYDTPEFLAVALDAGSGRYLDWLRASVGHASR